jgi:peptidyl-prolyl cis-trans isomerase A (cyclophilin A)
MKRPFLLMLAVAGCMLSTFACFSQTNNLNKVKDQPDGIYALITTTKGEILGFLESEKVPVTVANFVALAEGKMPNNAKPAGTPYYDGLTWHRVIPNFMIQGGDPQGNGQGGPGYSFPDEFDPSLKHDKPGMFSMANAGPGTNGSQFFITHVPTPWLDNKHSIFGHVVTGQEVVNAIAQGDKIVKVEIIRKGDKAKAFDAVKVFEGSKKDAQKKLDEQRKKDEEMVTKYKATAKTTASGLMYIIEKDGSGKVPNVGDTVTVHYSGTLLNGTKFDSSYDRNDPIKFPIGVGMVIKGWEEGIMMLKPGTKAKFIIPSNLAYGSQSPSPLIPANSTLVFDVELIAVTPKK